MTSIQAPVAELENLDSDVKGKGTRWKHLGRNTNALPRDGLLRGRRRSLCNGDGAKGQAGMRNGLVNKVGTLWRNRNETYFLKSRVT